MTYSHSVSASMFVGFADASENNISHGPLIILQAPDKTPVGTSTDADF